jgi:hypothetical protein
MGKIIVPMLDLLINQKLLFLSLSLKFLWC